MNFDMFTFQGPWIFNAIIIVLVGYFLYKAVVKIFKKMADDRKKNRQ